MRRGGGVGGGDDITLMYEVNVQSADGQTKGMRYANITEKEGGSESKSL